MRRTVASSRSATSCCSLLTACSKSRDPEAELYDYQQLSKAVGNRTELPVVELCRGLIDEVQQFSATQEFNDDVCLVAMDINRLNAFVAGKLDCERGASLLYGLRAVKMP